MSVKFYSWLLGNNIYICELLTGDLPLSILQFLVVLQNKIIGSHVNSIGSEI